MLGLTIIGLFVLFFTITNPKLLILNSIIQVLSIVNSFLGLMLFTNTVIY